MMPGGCKVDVGGRGEQLLILMSTSRQTQMNAPHSQASAVFGCKKEHGGPGIFSHVCNVKGRAHWGSEQHEELRYQITYHMYLPSGG